MERYAEQHRWLGKVTCLLACLILLSQLLISVRQLSQTADESTHIYAGFRAWKCGDFGFGPEHPPIARLVGAIPFVLADRAPANCNEVQPRQEALVSLDWLYRYANWDRLLFEARAAVSIFAVGVCVLVWVMARKMFGYTVALLAVTLLVFEPNILANGALVTTDMVLTCMFPLAIFAFYLWTNTRRIIFFVFTALATGLTLTAKQSGLIVIPVLLTLAVADAYAQRSTTAPRWKIALKQLGTTALICALAAVAVWGVYGFRFTARPDGVPLPIVNAQRGSFGWVLLDIRSAHLLPESYVQGLQTARVLARSSVNPVFLLGEVHPTGVWYFFPVAMVIKFTVPMLVLLLLALTAMGTMFSRWRREVLFLALPALAFLAGCMSAKMNSSIRHALPILPFALVLIAASCVEIMRRTHWMRYVLACAIVLHAVSSLHAFPNYLSYANEVWGGPARAYEYMPNNDWGESLKQVKRYLDEHPHSEPCWVASVYSVDIRNYGLPCRQFGGWLSEPVPPHMSGTVILSSVFLSTFRGAEWLRAFENRTPTDRIGRGTMLVYEGEFNTRELAVTSELNAAKRLLLEGDVVGALRHSGRAVEIEPENGGAHVEYCRALVVNGAIARARQECEVTRLYALAARTPLHWDAFDTAQLMLSAVGAP